MSISAVIITRNEEENIESCIKSLKFCNEIIVVDDFSTDKTLYLAKNLGAVVNQRKLANNFSDQRNYGLGKAKSDWILFIDADERVDQKLTEEIEKAIKKPLISGYFLKRLDIFLGKKIQFGETADRKHLRLVKKNSGKWQRPVHEVFKINGKTAILKQPLLHYPHPTISKFINEINQYTEIEANFRIKFCKKPSLIELLLFPFLKFIHNYFLLLGFLDGFPGFVIAYIMSLHSYTVRVKHRTN